MRVITGKARGTRLKSFEGTDVRPTTDKVKEAIFSSIQFCIEGSSVLDLFAGTGQLGIEALSRGANSAVFVDHNKNSINIIKTNLQLTHLADENIRVLNEDSLIYIKNCCKKFDFVFLDPPYRHDILPEILGNLPAILNDKAYIICEHENELNLPEKIGNLELSKKYKYGKISVSAYRHFTENGEKNENSSISGKL